MSMQINGTQVVHWSERKLPALATLRLYTPRSLEYRDVTVLVVRETPMRYIITPPEGVASVLLGGGWDLDAGKTAAVSKLGVRFQTIEGST